MTALGPALSPSVATRPTAWLKTLSGLRAHFAVTGNSSHPHSLPAMPVPPTVTAQAAQPAGMTVEHSFANGSPALSAYGGTPKPAFSTMRRFWAASTLNDAGNAGDSQSAVSWRVEVRANASKVAWRVAPNAAPFRLLVNGQYVDLTGTVPVTSGGNGYILVDTGSAADRVWAIEGEQGQALWGVWLEPGIAPSAPPGEGRRMIVLGDSFTEGVGATRRGDGFARVLGDSLGIKQVFASGLGGTGFVNAGSGPRLKLRDRLPADLNAKGPWDLIVVATGYNDFGLSGIEAEARLCFDLIRQANPQALVFVLTLWDGTAPAASGTNYAAVRSAVVQAAAGRGGFRVIDMQGVAYSKWDSTHPDTAGHKLLALHIASKIRVAYG